MSNNKNNDNKKLNSTRAKFAAAGLVSSVAFAVASPLIINAVNQKDSQTLLANVKKATTTPASTASQNTVKDANDSTKDIEIGLPSASLAKNVTPDFLYVIPTFAENDIITGDQKNAASLNAILSNLYLNAFPAYGISDDKSITAPYLEAFSSFSMLQGLSSAGMNNEDIRIRADNAKKQLSDPKTVLDSYNKINGLGSVIDTKMSLNITKPTQVRNILASSYKKSGSTIDAIDQSKSLLKTDGFAYKVAEIKLDKLKDQKSLVFSYNDHAATTAADYKIVISNENSEIDRFLSKPNGTLKDLIDNQTIFVRDMKGRATKPDTTKTAAATPFTNGKIQFTYDSNTKVLSLLALPDDSNTGSSYLEIGVDSFSDKDATKNTTLKYGLLDNTLSPTYLKQFDKNEFSNIVAGLENAWDASSWMGTNVGDVYGTDPKKRGGSGRNGTEIALLTDAADKLESKDIPIYSAIGEWDNNTSSFTDVKPSPANWLRLFIGVNNKISKPLQFNGKTDADNFGEGSPADISIDYSGGIKTVKPDSGILIRKSVADSATNLTLTTANIAVRTEEIDNPNTKEAKDKFLKADIGLNGGIISIDAVGNGNTSENPLTIANPASKIFFEDPFATTPATLGTQLVTIRTSPEVTTADKNQELIADIMKNWANKIPDPSSTSRILTQKEFYTHLRQIPNYKPDFDELDKLNSELKQLEADRDAATDKNEKANKEGVIVQQVAKIKDQLKKMIGYLPAWPTTNPNATAASPADAYMLFSTDYYKPLEEQFKAKGDDFGPTKVILDTYAYQYRQYSVDNEGSLIPPTTTTQGLYKYVDDQNDPLGLAAKQNSFNFELDDKGDKAVKVDATGTGIYEHFLKYTNEIFRWEKDKLQIKENVPAEDLYKVGDGSVVGWVQQTIVAKAGAAGTELTNVSNMLVKIWMGTPLTTTEIDVRNAFNKTFGDLFPGWEKIIKGKNDQTDPSFSATSEEYIVSQQLIYSMLQPYLVKCLNAIVSNEVSTLDTFILASTKQAFETFFKQSENVLQISDTAIKYVDPVEPENKQMKFITAGDYSVTSAANGGESLKSLIKFIYTSGISLENIGLTTDELNEFHSYAADIDTNLSDTVLFDNTISKQKFASFVSLLSKILDHVLDQTGETYVSLSDIATNIQKTSYDTAKGDRTAVSDLTDTIKKAIIAITNDAKIRDIDVLGAKASYSYLESLVIGRNLFEIYTEYLRRITPADANDHSRDAEIAEIKDFLAQNKQYDQSSVINLAFALGYYNIAYFIERLTTPNEIEPLADEMLKADLTRTVQLKVDSGNEVVNFLSNPKTLAKYSFMGIGGALTLAGGSIFGLSFRKSIRMSRKNVIIERFIFAGIIGLGLALTLFGVIPSIL